MTRTVNHLTIAGEAIFHEPKPKTVTKLELSHNSVTFYGKPEVYETDEFGQPTVYTCLVEGPGPYLNPHKIRNKQRR